MAMLLLAVALLPAQTSPNPAAARHECVDEEPNCRSWAGQGECTTNPDFMTKSCRCACESLPLCSAHCKEPCKVLNGDVEWECGACVESIHRCRPGAADFPQRSAALLPTQASPATTHDCADEEPNCRSWAVQGECTANPDFMKKSCRCACESGNVASACEDKHAKCKTWASIGECDTNPNFMRPTCPVTCRICQSERCRDRGDDCAARAEDGGCYTTPGVARECEWTCLACDLPRRPQCSRAQNEAPAATPGSMEGMFAAVAARDGVTVHSRDPWVLSLDGFLTDGEAESLLRAGQLDERWSRSQAGDGKHEVRTSSTAWCRSTCLAEPVVQSVQQRVAALTGVPTPNAEFMQVLKYEPGQFYG